jgi:hypothetical protein
VNQSYRGRSLYRSDIAEPSGNLLVAVVCRLGDLEEPELALLDTASQWCILPPRVALELGYDLEATGDTRFHTRFGLLSGQLIRLPLFFVADEGETAEIDATWFASGDWPGPIVIGWKGCLERIRFGFDPSDDSFYFAEL